MGSIYEGTGQKATSLIKKGGKKVGSAISGRAKEAWGDFWEERKIYKTSYKEAKRKAIKQRAIREARTTVLGVFDSRRMPRRRDSRRKRKSIWDL